MSEGGIFPWKRQQLRVPKTANYKDIQAPISLPKDKAWCRDPHTREWSVVDLETQLDGKNVAIAIPVAEPIHGKHGHRHGHGHGKQVQGHGTDHGRRIEFQEANIVTKHDHDIQKKIANEQNHNQEAKVEGTTEEQGADMLHTVLPTDTFQGICLRYSTTPTELRRYNKFSGTNLAFAPPTLVIPHYHHGKNKLQSRPQILTPEQKKQQLLQTFLNAFLKKRDEDTGMRVFGSKEALAYLEICDWNVDDAIQDARDDYGWEKGDSYSETKSLL